MIFIIYTHIREIQVSFRKYPEGFSAADLKTENCVLSYHKTQSYSKAENMNNKAIVKIRCNYPGGNVKVISQTAGEAMIQPDLRDTPTHWFYWNFEVEAAAPGVIRFTFPKGKQYLSAQGPCISRDGGKNWQWLGTADCFFLNEDPPNLSDSFVLTFDHAGETVRVAQGFPYQLADFQKFCEASVDAKFLHTLTFSNGGRPCPMIVVGEGKKTVLVTARHHACEAAASYVLEGFVAEAIKNQEFQKEYTLFAVPFMDLDGVEEGDQGKGRAPHDHNRDYALNRPLYAETAAVEALHREQKFYLALDFHDPAVRSDDCLYPGAEIEDAHEHFYFAGYQSPSNAANTKELIRWINVEFPPECRNPLIFGGKTPIKRDGIHGLPFSYYFGDDEDVMYGTTLEVPYANCYPEYDCNMMREAGHAILRAVMQTEFVRL